MDMLINQICYCIRNYTKKVGEELVVPRSVSDWEKLMVCSMQQSIAPIVYDVVRQSSEFKALPVELKETWKRNVRNSVTGQMRNDRTFAAVYDALKKSGVSPLVVKGAVLRGLYDEPEMRISGDEDVLIRSDEYETAHRVLVEQGFSYDQSDYENGKSGHIHEVTYYNGAVGLSIELHLSLFAKQDAIYSAYNEWFENVFDRIIEVQYKDNRFKTMSYNDHFLYLCCHAFKHFVHSGFGIRQVMDIVVMADKHGDKIEWEYVWAKLEEMNADVLFLNLFYIGEKYMGVKLERFGKKELIFSGDRDENCIQEKELLYELFDAGIYGKSSINRTRSSLMTLEAAKNNTPDVKKSKFKAMFPSVHDLEGRYKFLRRFPFLLPVAWIMRGVMYYSEKSKAGESVFGENESVRIGQERIKLLEQYKVVK